jgi:hypothetical protein
MLPAARISGKTCQDEVIIELANPTVLTDTMATATAGDLH